jgi:hypothetical protein
MTGNKSGALLLTISGLTIRRGEFITIMAWPSPLLAAPLTKQDQPMHIVGLSVYPWLGPVLCELRNSRQTGSIISGAESFLQALLKMWASNLALASV